jgi:DNA-binding MarR family transcriptional regulator
VRSRQEFELAAGQRLASLAPGLDIGSFRAVWLLHEAAASARRQMEEQALRPHAVSWMEFEILWHLWLFGIEGHRGIADELGISKGSVTAVTAALTGRGLLKRVADPADGRLVSFALTRKGFGLMRRMFPEVDRAESAVTSGLSAAERSELARLLGQLLSTPSAAT